ncbi:hypothetical protein [Corynebacterium ulcerans]|uniref:hypothetical protein n=1 Tax=Corynebacterium ulcerans TaxID=65058 RepID=UPI000696F885
MIWTIDPVYAAPGRRSRNSELWEGTARELSEFVGGDLAFSRKFSRNRSARRAAKTPTFGTANTLKFTAFATSWTRYAETGLRATE